MVWFLRFNIDNIYTGFIPSLIPSFIEGIFFALTKIKINTK